MSCQPTTSTSWVQSSSTYETTQYVTSIRTTTTTATTVVPVLNRWCTSSTAAAETPASDSNPRPVLANNFAAPAPDSTPGVSSPLHDHKMDHPRFKNKHINWSRSDGFRARRAHVKKQSPPSSSKFSDVSDGAEVHINLALRDDPPSNQCVAWATETQWVTLQPTFTETIAEVATNTALATTQVWVPSVITQACIPTLGASAGSTNIANQWKLNTAFAAASQPSATSISVTTSTYHHALAQPHIPTFIATTSDSSAVSLASSPGAGSGTAASSVIQNKDISSKDDQVSSKIAWGCGALGATIFIGILAWIVMVRRKKNRVQRDNNEEEREILEEKRFFDDWHNEDGGHDDGIPVAPVPFRQIALEPMNEAPKNDAEEVQNSRLTSRFSAGSSLREIYDLRGPVASAFVRPLSVLGQSRPKKQVITHVAPVKVARTTAELPRNYPATTSEPSAKNPFKQNTLGSSSSGGSYRKPGSQSRAKSAIAQSGEPVGNHYRPASQGKSIAIAAMAPTMKISEVPESENFSALSPGPLNTGRSLTMAFSPVQRQQHDLLSMSGEGEQLQTPLEPVGRILSVGELSPNEEPEASRMAPVLSIPKHESGWYTKSILRDWLPSSSHSRSVKGYAV
ncbi:hypothetical protein QFC22_004333 [Naganishia vaughanmartiniae]|uniref:Uncharacterized protein n=1 Tax=Naganishia vaughanmartiniae TaxID=1424756 RepID=A0ACC2X192_9TREE|nr:hypothetical protein QFC22_004333 [Naganishia vaughanmartiniae]